jgi:hypothetical protein
MLRAVLFLRVKPEKPGKKRLTQRQVKEDLPALSHADRPSAELPHKE